MLHSEQNTTSKEHHLEQPRRDIFVSPPQSKHSATLIFLTGLGDDGSRWNEIVRDWRSQRLFPHLKVVILRAEYRYVTCFRKKLYAWHDFHKRTGIFWGRDFFNESDPILQQARSSMSHLRSVISSENSLGIPCSRIIVGGFSQGGSIALLTTMLYRERLAGCVVLSGFINWANVIADSDKSEYPNRSVTILQCHGTDDPLIKYKSALIAKVELESLGFRSVLKTYRGLRHKENKTEMQDVVAYIQECLGEETEMRMAKL